MSGGGMNYAASAMSFSGTLESGRAQANTDEYNAKVAQNNADAIENQGTAVVEAQQRAFMRTLGSMKAAMGGAGIDTSMGSPLEVLADSVRSGTLDQLTTKYNYDVAATSQRDQAALDKLGARNARASGFFNALANGLSGMSSGQVNAGGYGQQQGYANSYAYGGNSLTPGSTYTGTGSTFVGWPGDGQAETGSFNSLDGSGTYNGTGSQSITWAGFGGGFS